MDGWSTTSVGIDEDEMALTVLGCFNFLKLPFSRPPPGPSEERRPDSPVNMLWLVAIIPSLPDLRPRYYS